MHHRAVLTLSLCVLAAAHTGCVTAVVAPFQPENLGGETIVLITIDAPGFPLVVYVLTGFAPRQFLRLEPR